MKLDDIIGRPEYNILRVPGGWIYRFWDFEADNLDNVGTFVPFDNDLQVAVCRDTVSNNPKFIEWLKAKRKEEVEVKNEKD